MTLPGQSPRRMSRAAVATAAWMSRDRVAVLAGLATPLILAVILVPFRSGLPNTDAALALILVVVAVAASGHRLAGVLAAAWFDFFLTVPYERFTITRRADVETTVLLLAIGTRPALEQRLVAVALADQPGAALSGGHLVSRS
jgi:K+-sensing histidine kinase KdpD